MKILILSPYPETLNIKGDVTMDALKKVPPHDVIVSYGYRRIIPKHIIEGFKKPIINLHISYFPWNKGADPNFWSWYDDTPKGVTIHEIDSGVDTGGIILQREVKFGPLGGRGVRGETLESTYWKLRANIEELFNENWPQLLDMPRIPHSGGSSHKLEDLKRIWKFYPRGWDTPVNFVRQSAERQRQLERLVEMDAYRT